MVFITHNNEHREREQRPAKVFTCGMMNQLNFSQNNAFVFYKTRIIKLFPL